jgi:hypothetical protein
MIIDLSGKPAVITGGIGLAIATTGAALRVEGGIVEPLPGERC